MFILQFQNLLLFFSGAISRLLHAEVTENETKYFNIPSIKLRGALKAKNINQTD